MSASSQKLLYRSGGRDAQRGWRQTEGPSGRHTPKSLWDCRILFPKGEGGWWTWESNWHEAEWKTFRRPPLSSPIIAGWWDRHSGKWEGNKCPRQSKGLPLVLYSGNMQNPSFQRNCVLLVFSVWRLPWLKWSDPDCAAGLLSARRYQTWRATLPGPASAALTWRGGPREGDAGVVIKFLLEFVLLLWKANGIIKECRTVYQNGLHGMPIVWGPCPRANWEECCTSTAPSPCRFACKAMRRAGAKPPVSFWIILPFSYLVDHSNHFYLVLLSSWGADLHSEHSG